MVGGHPEAELPGRPDRGGVVPVELEEHVGLRIDARVNVVQRHALTRATAIEARVQGQDSRKTPEWASTHPLSENRVRQAAQTAQATRRAGQGLRNRDAFLAQVEGVLIEGGSGG